ncbi:GGDEF domain-containing protein [Mycobacterium sp. 050128]
MTASIGTAAAELHRWRDSDTSDLVDQLISIADAAMYAAKRNGGNQVQHA